MGYLLLKRKGCTQKYEKCFFEKLCLQYVVG